MKKVFKPASLLFNLLSLLAFFVIGLLFAGWVDAGKGQMLAAGAIVLGYGVLFGVIALVGSFFFTYYAKHRIIVVGNIIFAVFLLASFAYFRYRFVKMQEEKPDEHKEMERKPTAPVDHGKLLAMIGDVRQSPFQNEREMGLGFFAPNFNDYAVFYFYGNLNFDKSVMEHSPTDSIVFRKSQYGGFDIAQAPPWLAPRHMKLDYDLLYFHIRSLGKDFVEVTVNTQTVQTAYVNKYQGKVVLWPEFLLSVHSVEFHPESDQQVKTRPFEASDEVSLSFSFMQPMLIREDWMQVELWSDNFEKVGKGWIRWKKDGELLVTYSLLS